MEKKSNIFLRLSKLKKNELIELAKKNNITINLNSKKDDLVNLLFYCANKKCYKIPKSIITKKPNNGQVYSIQGHRPSMEDTHLIAKLDDIQLYGIFDGHGGNYTSDILPTLVTKHLLNPLSDVNIKYNSKKIISHINQAFINIDNEIYNNITDESGSTAVIILNINNLIYLINLGDSRAVIFKYINGKKKTNYVFSSKDHKPEDELERNRIYQMGGFVETEEDDDPRLNGYLAISRSFGDFELKTIKESFKGPLSIEPDIKIIQKRDNSNYIAIIGCDGLWDVMSNNHAIQYVDKFGIEKGAENLVNIAFHKGSTDNISVIVTTI